MRTDVIVNYSDSSYDVMKHESDNHIIQILCFQVVKEWNVSLLLQQKKKLHLFEFYDTHSWMMTTYQAYSTKL